MEEINRDNVEDINNEEEIKDLLLSSKNSNFKISKSIPLDIKAYEFFNNLYNNNLFDESTEINFSFLRKNIDNFYQLQANFINAIDKDNKTIILTNEQYNEHYQTIKDLISGKIDLKKKQTKNVKANKSKEIISNNKFISLDNGENIYFNKNKKSLSNFYINIDLLSKITNVDLHNIRRMGDSLLKKKGINNRGYFDYKNKVNKNNFINNDNNNSLIKNKEKDNLGLNKTTKFISLEGFFDILEQYVK